MKSIPLLLAFFLLACDSRADQPDGKIAATEPKAIDSPEFQFDGVWKPKGAMLAGVLIPPPALEAITLTIEDGKYEVTVTGEAHSDRGTFTLDETVTPKRMTIKSLAGPNQGKTILAIYEIKNMGAMRVCYDLSGKEFPKEFKAPKNTELYLVGYRRQVAKETESSQNAESGSRNGQPDQP